MIRSAAKAMEHYQASGGAEEVIRLPMGDKIGHAEIPIGNSRIMLAISGPWARTRKISPPSRLPNA
ncbi:MAG: PhnB protein [Limisphaerales bacterium]|jgi:PhnB protein